MPTVFEPADEEVMDLVGSIMADHHPELVEVDLRICVLMATAEKDEAGLPKTDAVKLHGVPCAAVVKIVPYKQRVVRKHDAEITVDADKWKDSTDAQRAALIDHEMVHILVVKDKDGHVKSDDCGRPKLKMRPHDWELSGFEEIVQRHAGAAIEAQEVHYFADKYGQLVLEWARDTKTVG